MPSLCGKIELQMRERVFLMIKKVQKIKMIKLKDIFPNPYQIRRKFDRKKLLLLSDSIKKMGVLCPITVRISDTGYEIISGQRRVIAAKMAQKEEIPAIIIGANDAQCALLSMAENIHRENLTPYEEAEGFFNLISYHRMKKDRLLTEICTESAGVNEKIRLLSLPEKVRYKLEENLIDEKTARQLLRLHDEEKQLEVIEKIKENNLKTAEVETMIREILRAASFSKSKGRRKMLKNSENIPIYINTVKKTADILKSNGARVEISQNESEKYIEFSLKIAK